LNSHHEKGNTGPLRGLVEGELESVGAGNIVELVRDVVGPEPWREQPRVVRLLAVVCLGGALAAILFFEWNFSSMIPVWISFPLTIIAAGSYVWKYLGHRKSGNPATLPQITPAQSPTQALSQDQSQETRDAKFLARFLVANIKCFNSELVAEGVRIGRLYPLLKEEIDNARSIYDSNIPPATRDKHDYFQDELVRILANGNAELLRK
jgi:hypothetical protein